MTTSSSEAHQGFPHPGPPIECILPCQGNQIPQDSQPHRLPRQQSLTSATQNTHTRTHTRMMSTTGTHLVANTNGPIESDENQNESTLKYKI
jgi:hypothetical protein